ncbi:hypothetical protein GOP47_0018004 [Adiantum capillus-veneris]|uniref:Uncharacterized protein n=1 Tax=Adiantum capillus-veneris TaxID=13818 RepID=A0A9D4UGI4_ADICA|nr:hypothetical protein GOP47_0018004 [Adiantum capillus-veneris]
MEDVTPTTGDTLEENPSPYQEKTQPALSSSRKVAPKYEESLAEMVGIGKLLLELHLKETASHNTALEKERLNILAAMRMTMSDFLKESRGGDK